MKMSIELANSIMDGLACLCICANGGVPKDGLTDKQTKMVEQYSRETFLFLCNEWEDTVGEKWDIVETY